MQSTLPMLGVTVLYILSESDAMLINRHRNIAENFYRIADNPDDYAVAAQSLYVHAGDMVPMIITKIWPDDPNAAVNGTALLDGGDIHWLLHKPIDKTRDTIRTPGTYRCMPIYTSYTRTA